MEGSSQLPVAPGALTLTLSLGLFGFCTHAATHPHLRDNKNKPLEENSTALQIFFSTIQTSTQSRFSVVITAETQEERLSSTSLRRAHRAGERAEWVKGLASEPDNLSSIPGTNMVDEGTDFKLFFGLCAHSRGQTQINRFNF